MTPASKQLAKAIDAFPRRPEDEADEAAAALAAMTAALDAGADPMARDQNGRPIAFMAASAP